MGGKAIRSLVIGIGGQEKDHQKKKRESWQNGQEYQGKVNHTMKVNRGKLTDVKKIRKGALEWGKNGDTKRLPCVFGILTPNVVGG